MDTHTIHFGLAMLAAGFWVPAGIWLMLNRHALTVLASIPVEDDQPLPTVSVVIPARNEERNLEQALESVLALDYPDLEMITVNDRSTDRTGATFWAIMWWPRRPLPLAARPLHATCSLTMARNSWGTSSTA